MSMDILLRGKSVLENEESLSKIGEGKTFFENSIVRSLLLLQSVLLVSLSGLFVFFLRPSDSLTVLHYNVYFGVDLLGSWWQPVILPGVVLVFVLVNLLLSYRFYARRQERIAAYLLLLGSVMLLSGIGLGCISVFYINY